MKFLSLGFLGITTQAAPPPPKKKIKKKMKKNKRPLVPTEKSNFPKS